RPVIDPPIPSFGRPDRSWNPDSSLEAQEADFAAQHSQFRFVVAPPPFVYPFAPEYQPMIRVGWTGFPVGDQLAWGNPYDGRFEPTNTAPQWSDTWWDETTSGTFGGPAVRGDTTGIFEPGGI